MWRPQERSWCVSKVLGYGSKEMQGGLKGWGVGLEVKVGHWAAVVTNVIHPNRAIQELPGHENLNFMVVTLNQLMCELELE